MSGDECIPLYHYTNSLFWQTKKNLGEIDEAVGGEKGIPDPDGLCCNYRADCNGSAAVAA
jgi:hypothetical protein